MAVISPPVQATPLPHRLTLMGIPPYSQGLEVELGLPNTPLHLGGQFIYLRGLQSTAPWAPFTPHSGARHQVDVWLHAGHRLGDDVAIGLLAGLQQSWEPGITTGDYVTRHQSAGLLGVTYERTWEAWRLRLRPTFLVIPEDWRWLPWYGVMAKSAVLGGIPWVEVGYRVAPWAEISVRASTTPLALTLTF